MPKYSILLLLPDYISDGHETFYGHFEAETPRDALKEAQEDAAKECDCDAPEDFALMLMIHGIHTDISQEAIF